MLGAGGGAVVLLALGPRAGAVRILISAYACEPGRGSEPEAGWQYAKAAAEITDHVTVLTRSNNRGAIEAWPELPPNMSFIYHDLGRPARWLKSRLPGGVQLYYLFWQLSARKVVRREGGRHTYNLTHHLTFAVDWMPIACRIPEVPLVWGPVGGATGLPWRMWRDQGARGLMREIGRELASRSLRRVWGRRVARGAAVTLVQSPDGERLFRDLAGGDVIVRPNVVVDPSVGRRADLSGIPMRTERRTALFAGRVIPHKGLVYALHALATDDAADWDLLVAGAGSQLPYCRRLVDQLGIANRVTFLGWLGREEVAGLLRTVDAMVAPSMYEGSGFAVAEAVTLGCPVVGTARGGPNVMVPTSAGILVPADERLSDALARALRDLGPRTGGTDVWTASALTPFLAEIYRRAAS